MSPSKLSIIIPVYNEERNLKKIVEKVSAIDINKEIIIVDDGSKDATAAILRELRDSIPFVLISFAQNEGKGAAIAEALPHVTGDIVVIQDADLEYDPADLPGLMACFSDPRVDVVYGSRILGKTQRGRLDYYLGGMFLCRLCNLLFSARLTDMTTCYKMLRVELMKSLALKSRGFEFCAELTARILKKRIPIVERPIHYLPRSRAEGKKLLVRDGFRLFWVLLRERFF